MIKLLYDEETDEPFKLFLWRMKGKLASETNVRGNAIMQPIAVVTRNVMKWDITADLVEILKIG